MSNILTHMGIIMGAGNWEITLKGKLIQTSGNALGKCR